MDTIIIAMHKLSKRPACVNLQAAFGCTDRQFFMHTFDSQDWEVNDIDNIVLVSGTKEQWQRHARMLDIARASKN